jgi:hypothetical protein
MSINKSIIQTCVVIIMASFWGCIDFHMIRMDMNLNPTRIKIKIIPDNFKNDGYLLPLDIIATTENKSIRSIEAEDWFAHKQRESLVINKELFSYAINSRTPLDDLYINVKNVKEITIFADYEKLYDDKGQKIVLPIKKFRFQYTILSQIQS